MTRRRENDPPRTLEQLREQLRLELRADVVAGRGQLPRDRSGRVSSSFLEANRSTPAPAKLGLTSLGDILAAAAPQLRPQLTPAELEQLGYVSSRVKQLEELERSLGRLLESSAPKVYEQLRAPLRRLLNRARRELRALDRSEPLT